jgi:flavin reductase (DIM6/NTAB) family NADH-FMN oxidoreductase RutF
MYFDIEALDASQSYKLITGTVVPRPIAWVVTQDAEGRSNAAPFSFFNVFGGHPPVVCVGMGRYKRGAKDSLNHVQARGEFVVNLVPHALAEAMNLTATDFPAGWSELVTAGLATAPSHKVAVPRIAASPVALECRLLQCVPLPPESTLVMAQVVAMHVRDDAVQNVERCHIDSDRLDLIGRMQSPGGYVRCSDTFRMRQLDFASWQAANPGVEPPTGRDPA